MFSLTGHMPEEEVTPIGTGSDRRCHASLSSFGVLCSDEHDASRASCVGPDMDETGPGRCGPGVQPRAGATARRGRRGLAHARTHALFVDLLTRYSCSCCKHHLDVIVTITVRLSLWIPGIS